MKNPKTWKGRRGMIRVVVLTSPYHLYGNYIVKKLLQHTDACQLVGIVESTVVLPRKRLHESLWRLVESAGLFFFIAQSLKKVIFRFGCELNSILDRKDVENVFYYYRRVTRERGIPVLATDDVNTEEGLEFIKACNADLITIALFAQILKEQTLSIPRLGCLNFHPSLLPRNRGLMPIFWALAEGQSESGATIHKVDTGIDTGPTVAQETTRIRDDDTEHSLYARICVIGARLLLGAIEQLNAGSGWVPADPPVREGSYHSLPTKEAVRRFRAAGRRFFRMRELSRPFELL